MLDRFNHQAEDGRAGLDGEIHGDLEQVGQALGAGGQLIPAKDRVTMPKAVNRPLISDPTIGRTASSMPLSNPEWLTMAMIRRSH